MWRWGVWIWLTESWTLHRNSPQGLNIISTRVFDQIRDPEIPITLRHHIYTVYHHHYQSVLPKGRSFTASAGTKVVFLPKAGLLSQTQEPRLHFYQGLNLGAIVYMIFFTYISEEMFKVESTSLNTGIKTGWVLSHFFIYPGVCCIPRQTAWIRASRSRGVPYLKILSLETSAICIILTLKLWGTMYIQLIVCLV